MSLDDLRDEHRTFRVLAVDHRDSLRVFLAPEAPETVPASELTAIKDDLVRVLSPMATGVMLEPEYSIPQVIESGALAPGVGFTAALEAQGYLADPGASPTSILPGWSVEAAAASGAAAAKLLLPYHPEAPLAAEQEGVAAAVIAECRRVGLPLALEPLFFDLADPIDRERVVLATIDRFAPLEPELLKLPFPVDPAVVPDHGDRIAACRRVTVRCRQPWAILSGGGSFESFAEQVDAAMAGGAAGYMVGRALWGESAHAASAARRTVIEEVVVPRWHRLADIAARYRGPTSEAHPAHDQPPGDQTHRNDASEVTP